MTGLPTFVQILVVVFGLLLALIDGDQRVSPEWVKERRKFEVRTAPVTEYALGEGDEEIRNTDEATLFEVRQEIEAIQRGAR